MAFVRIHGGRCTWMMVWAVRCPTEEKSQTRERPRCMTLQRFAKSCLGRPKKRGDSLWHIHWVWATKTSEKDKYNNTDIWNLYQSHPENQKKLCKTQIATFFPISWLTPGNFPIRSYRYYTATGLVTDRTYLVQAGWFSTGFFPEGMAGSKGEKTQIIGIHKSSGTLAFWISNHFRPEKRAPKTIHRITKKCTKQK